MWTQLQLSAADKAAAGLRMAVAVLLNSIWPENGSTLNRFRRLESSTALVFVLTDGRSENSVATADQGTSGVRALGSASLRALRDSDGPELAQVARACESACVLFSLLVDKPLQGQGLGTAILKRMEAEAARLGHSHVFLTAEPDVASFYAKHGYEVVSDPSWKQRTRKRMLWLRKLVLGGAPQSSHSAEDEAVS